MIERGVLECGHPYTTMVGLALAPCWCTRGPAPVPERRPCRTCGQGSLVSPEECGVCAAVRGELLVTQGLRVRARAHRAWAWGPLVGSISRLRQGAAQPGDAAQEQQFLRG